MKIIKRPGRRYRRYRQEIRYDSPRLTFFMSASPGLLKILLILSLLMAGWVVTKRPTAPTEAELAAVASENSTVSATAIAHRANPLAGSSAQPNSNVIVSTDPPDNSNVAPLAVITDYKDTEANKGVTPLQPEDELPLSSAQADSDDTSGIVADIVDETWIQELDPTSYIIQFGSSPERSLLDEMIPFINQDEPIAIYPFRRTPSGRPVYAIDTSVYDNPDTALAAIESFSAQARTYSPWVKKISHLKEEITALTQ